MSYSIFRAQGITHTGAFNGLCKHDKDRISKTNPDINPDKSKDNIDLISCNESYKKKFDDITKDMRAEHEKRMKHTRSDRVKSFEQYVNSSKNNVGTELLFTSDEEFFKGMDRADIQKWAESSLEFVTNDIGIPKSNIIHAVVHLDEKTPHLHVVCVPLVHEYDKRAKEERWAIRQTKFLGNRKNLSKLQDKYNDLMKNKGYDLQRGEKGTLTQHKETIEYKKEQLEKAIQSLSQRERVTQETINTMREINPKKSIIGNNITISEKEYDSLKTLAMNGAAALLKYVKLEEELNKTRYDLEDKIKNLISDLKMQKELKGIYADELKKYKINNNELKQIKKILDNLGLSNKIYEEMQKNDSIVRSINFEIER